MPAPRPVRRRRRWLRVFKWFGTILSAFLLGVGLYSCGWYMVVQIPVADGAVRVGVAHCALELRWLYDDPEDSQRPLQFTRRRWAEDFPFTQRSYEGNLFGWNEFYQGWWGSTPYFYLTVPAWQVCAPVFLPTALLWRLDRRRRPGPGDCQHCGYNLTGNQTGICPECGISRGADKAAQPVVGHR